MSKREFSDAAAAAEAPGDAASILSLTGKVVLVTGASSGIGRAIALACADAGADLALGYHTNEPGAAEVAGAIQAAGRRAHAAHVDTADSDDVQRFARTMGAAFSRVDVWINNAGADILTGQNATASRLEKLDRLIAVDLRGTIVASWAAVDLLRRQPGGGGVIINMSWDHVLSGGMKGEYAQLFAAAKGGIYSFSRTLASAVAPQIRVNVLGPGWIETAYGNQLDPVVKQRITAAIPLGRWGTPEDVAHAAVYLASDAAAYVTGQMLMINGGSVI